jgi:hypothetical protein
MKTGRWHLMPSKGRLLPVGIIGFLSLLVLLLWWGGAPAAFAQEAGEGESRDSQAGSGGNIGDLDQDALRCILGILGRVPSNLQDLTDEEKRGIAEKCFSGGQRGTAGPAVPDGQSSQCIIRVLGRVPASPDDFTDDEKRQVAQTCFGTAGGGGFNSLAGARSDQDGGGTKCILEVLGRVPSSLNDISDDEKRRIAQTCSSAGRGGPRGQGGAGRPDEAGTQCILEVLGRMPTGPNDFTEEEKRRVGQACFSDRGGPRGEQRGSRGPNGSDDATR